MNAYTTKHASPTARPGFWYEGSTGVSGLSEVTFAVVDYRGSTVEAEVESGSVEPEVNWVEVLRASAQTSFAFLANEPDLYED